MAVGAAYETALMTNRYFYSYKAARAALKGTMRKEDK
jgi:hypothetical protein